MATHLNLHLLRLFAAVVEHHGFSRAADALFVTQSAVSKGVRELERQLDLALLDRSSTDGGRRGVRLTDAGEALYRHARALFAMEKAALEDVRDRVGLHRGRLRIGASTTVAGYWLPPALARFAAAHPDIALSLQVDNTAGVAEAVAAGGLDVGFVEGAVEDPRLRALRWRDEPLQLVTADDDPLALGRRVEDVRRDPHGVELLLGHRPATQPVCLQEIGEKIPGRGPGMADRDHRRCRPLLVCLPPR